MRSRSLVFALVSLLLPAIGFANDSLEQQLTQQYRNKIFALRHSFKSDNQEYDVDGRPVTTSVEGPWSIYGRISVKKVVFNEKGLRLEGYRVLYIQDDKKGFIPVLDRETYVRISVRLKAPLTSADQAIPALNMICSGPADVVNSAPPYWQTYLRQQAAAKQNKQQDAQQAPETENAATNESEKIYLLNEKGVTPPKALSTPEPEFSEDARARRYQGTVGVSAIIDKTGAIQRVQIVHPLGMGLDENAVSTMRTWRFTPAIHDGEPVAVKVLFEVDFRLRH